MTLIACAWIWIWICYSRKLRLSACLTKEYCNHYSKMFINFICQRCNLKLCIKDFDLFKCDVWEHFDRSLVLFETTQNNLKSFIFRPI